MNQSDLCVKNLQICLTKSSKIVKGTTLEDAKLNERIGRKKYECRVHMQICALLSQGKQHIPALTHAKDAARAAHACVSDSLMLCQKHMAKYKAAQTTAASETEFLKSTFTAPGFKKNHDLVKKAGPVLGYLEAKMKGRKTPSKAPRIEMRSALGLQRYSDWIFSFNMKNLMVVEQLTMFELKNSFDPMNELTKEMVLEKICILVASYFCIATELRFTSDLPSSTSPSFQEAQHWHFRSLEIAQDLLPQECPLLEHIKSGYYRYYTVLPAPLNPVPSKEEVARSMSAKLSNRSTLGERWTGSTTIKSLCQSQLFRSNSRSPERIPGLLEERKSIKSKSSSQIIEKKGEDVSGRRNVKKVRRVVSKSPISRRTKGKGNEGKSAGGNKLNLG